MKADKEKDLNRFNELLADLEDGVGGKRQFSASTGQDTWPNRGVYFLFEPGEYRQSTRQRLRVTRVGTHAVSKGAKAKLWTRLRSHKGTTAGAGNHRRSVFRLHVGEALLNKHKGRFNAPFWGQARSAGPEIRSTELSLAKAVSEYIGKVSILWLAIDDIPSKHSDRAYIERNSIALLSNFNVQIDALSASWLGDWSSKEAIRKSGLWNVRHVEEDYDPRFLDVMADYVDITLGRKPKPEGSIAPIGWHD